MEEIKIGFFPLIVIEVVISKTEVMTKDESVIMWSIEVVSIFPYKKVFERFLED